MLEYERKLTLEMKKSTVPFCIIEFEAWLSNENKTLATCLGMSPQSLTMDIPSDDFFKKLEAVNYVPKDKAELEKTIAGQKPRSVSLKKLSELIEKQKPKLPPAGAAGAPGAPGQLPGKITNA